MIKTEQLNIRISKNLKSNLKYYLDKNNLEQSEFVTELIETKIKILKIEELEKYN